MRSYCQLLIEKEQNAPKTTTLRHKKRKDYPTTIEITNLKWNVRSQNWQETYWCVWEIPIKTWVGGRKEENDFDLQYFTIRARQMGELVLPYLFIFNKCLNIWFSANVLVPHLHYFSFFRWEKWCGGKKKKKRKKPSISQQIILSLLRKTRMKCRNQAQD